ncbi:hypothetical protein [Clostridium sp.]|uniref:hypothetical protein n=1 Tax=Clostridium sp. TaxID=1506 RepID=UPI0028428C55|nr:hypothetical protein [Clostridium sp.]MDR3598529.1 hypothetical protein [Clostridium sp.]
MNKNKRRKLKLNMKFDKGIVVCAKSPIECRECKYIKWCETIDTYYYPFEGINECLKNSERKR